MSESMGDTTSSAFEKPDGREAVLSLTTARNMLPLMRLIVDDVLLANQRVAQLQPEHQKLYRRRHSLNWPERARRYHLEEELHLQERNLRAAMAEMEELGVSLLDPTDGRIGFPTIVNGRRAFFSWRPGQEGLRHWHYAGETALRPIPSTWDEPVAPGVSSKR